ncbi:unnamed protein product [Penicillium salamii]|nr:unnamed protein product [Penicillium salamii]
MTKSKELISLRVALISEQRSKYLGLGYSQEECAALTHDGEIQAVLSTLKNLGHHTTLVLGVESLVQQLAVGKHKDWDLAFNMAQGFHGPAREAQVPALLEAYQVPYTFADSATMALCQNKANTKIVLCHHGIPIAPFLVVPVNKPASSAPNFTSSGPQYPLFVKPVTEGSSKGMDTFNKVNDSAELTAAVEELKSKFSGQDILVESYLPGRELTVAILGTGENSRVIGVRELIWKNQTDSTNGVDGHAELEFASRLSKSSKDNTLVYRDHDLTQPQIQAAWHVSLDVWKLLGCRDAGRIDLRFDSDKPYAVPNIMEVSIMTLSFLFLLYMTHMVAQVNLNSGLLPIHSPLPDSAERNGMSYADLLEGIIESALRRYQPTAFVNGSS